LGNKGDGAYHVVVIASSVSLVHLF